MANVRDRHWTVGVGRARGCYRAADHAGREVLAEGSDILFRELVLGLLLVRGQPRVCSPSVRCVVSVQVCGMCEVCQMCETEACVAS